MYFRLYPAKNTTIFRYWDSFYSSNSFPATVDPNTVPQPISWSLNTNTGANPIMELQDGKGESILLFDFELPLWLRKKLQVYPFSCNLKLWDAGTLFEPAIKLKNVKLKYFTDEFVEGDGYSFLKGKAKQEVSNFIYRDSINLWSATSFSDVSTYHLNRINEDLLFEVTSQVNNSAITSNLNPKFALSIDNREEDDFINIYTKFIHSRHTRTVFKPYLEFFINDTIQDKMFSCIATETNKIYLLNERNTDFTGTVIATVTDNLGNNSTPVVLKPNTGIYYIEITPTLPTSYRDEYLTIKWNIGGIDLYKQTIKVLNPNKVFNDLDIKNLNYYLSTPYSHNIIRQGDIVPFEVTSQIRGKGDVINLNYEYKVLSMGEFEMVPWTPISVYRDRMFFNIDTSFFFPEQQYEVFIRNREHNSSITSSLTYKFKLKADSESHLRNMNASPYYNRDYFFSK